MAVRVWAAVPTLENLPFFAAVVVGERGALVVFGRIDFASASSLSFKLNKRMVHHG
jgi:hypothetical protein